MWKLVVLVSLALPVSACVQTNPNLAVNSPPPVIKHYIATAPMRNSIALAIRNVRFPTSPSYYDYKVLRSVIAGGSYTDAEGGRPYWCVHYHVELPILDADDVMRVVPEPQSDGKVKFTMTYKFGGKGPIEECKKDIVYEPFPELADAITALNHHPPLAVTEQASR